MTNRIGITSRYNQVEFNLINQLAKLNKTDTKSIQKFFVTKELSRLVEESKKQAQAEKEKQDAAQRNTETVAETIETSSPSGVEEQK
jgi:hypothetical protein